MTEAADDMKAGDPVRVVPYDPAWPPLFARLGGDVRAALGNVAVRIDHIGSTAVPGLVAKPVIDIQVSVAAFEPLAAYRLPLERLGYVFRADNTERTKRYFREARGTRRTHIHVRQAGSFSEQFALLFRDFLRTHLYSALEAGPVRRLSVHSFPSAARPTAMPPTIRGTPRSPRPRRRFTASEAYRTKSVPMIVKGRVARMSMIVRPTTAGWIVTWTAPWRPWRTTPRSGRRGRSTSASGAAVAGARE